MKSTRSVLGVFVLSILLAALIAPGVPVPAQDREVIYGVRVTAPETYTFNHAKYRFFAEQRDIKPGSLDSKTMPPYFRYIINLDLFAVNVKDLPKKEKVEITDIYSDGLDIRVEIPVSIFDLEQVRRLGSILRLYFWDEKTKSWVLPKPGSDVDDLKFQDGMFSFKVKKWPLDDRAIGAGG
jgi:hypothetical protein